MRRQTTAAVALAGALLGPALALAGCGASEPTTSEAAAAGTAEEVCALLRRWDNEFAVRANAATGAVTDDDDPATANGVLLGGFDDLIAIAEAHQEEAAALALPFTPERSRLLAEIRDGTADAIERLEDERDEIADLPPIEIGDQGGALGGALLALESAVSATEPRVELYEDEEVRQAFKDDPGCDHVVQSDLIIEQD